MNTLSRRNDRALDALNFFLADVRDGIGPFLAIWLLATHDWDPVSIGLAMGAMPLASVLMLGPAGALADRLRAKRLLLVLACGVVAVGCIAMTAWPTMAFVLAWQAALGMATAVIAPCLLAITLGLAGPRLLARRTGRNEVFNHAGNVVSAVLAGLVGHFFAREAIFYLVAVWALLSIIAALCIRAGDIDHVVARGGLAPACAPRRLKRWAMPKALKWFALATLLFHLGNAAMMPLVGQQLARGLESGASLYMSACIVVAQLVMIPMAALAGARASTWGRRPLLLLAFAALPVRGVLYTVSDDPAWLIAVQALDGVGVGLLGVVGVLVVADLTRGSGHTNLVHGLLAAATGVGAFLSNAVVGHVVNEAGYATGFLALAATAAVALVVVVLRVPETLNAQAPAGLTPTHFTTQNRGSAS